MQIESLSKRLDRTLYCKVHKVDDMPITMDNYWRIVRVFPKDEWLEMSAAQITLKVVDPALAQISAMLNEWEEVETTPLPKVDDVGCFVCTDGSVPIRMLITEKLDGGIVVVIDFAVRKVEHEG